MNRVIFSPSENYLTRINGRRSYDEPGASLEPILAAHLGLDPFPQMDVFQTLTMAPKDKEDEEVWEDDDEEDEEDWDDEDDWDDDEDEDWDDEDDEDEDWDDEDEDEDWDEDEDYDEDEE